MIDRLAMFSNLFRPYGFIRSVNNQISRLLSKSTGCIKGNPEHAFKYISKDFISIGNIHPCAYCKISATQVSIFKIYVKSLETCFRIFNYGIDI